MGMESLLFNWPRHASLEAMREGTTPAMLGNTGGALYLDSQRKMRVDFVFHLTWHWQAIALPSV